MCLESKPNGPRVLVFCVRAATRWDVDSNTTTTTDSFVVEVCLHMDVCRLYRRRRNFLLTSSGLLKDSTSVLVQNFAKIKHVFKCPLLNCRERVHSGPRLSHGGAGVGRVGVAGDDARCLRRRRRRRQG